MLFVCMLLSLVLSVAYSMVIYVLLSWIVFIIWICACQQGGSVPCMDYTDNYNSYQAHIAAVVIIRNITSSLSVISHILNKF
jgi:hypothetical protein